MTSIIEIYKRFPTQDDCLKHLEKVRWGDDPMCPYCGADTNGRNKYFAVDHCHKTGKVRGLLCTHCNHGLGSFRDNQTALKEALVYLEKSLATPAI